MAKMAMTPPIYIVTLADRLYKVCDQCRVSQPMFILIDKGKVIMACCVCQWVHTEVIV